MNLNKKLSLYYSAFALGFLTLILGIFAIMYSIEGFTSYLEFKLWRRNLGDIVDKPYELKIEDRKEERIDFLVELTQFFYNFHENTVLYKEKLEDFMFRRETIRQRIERTDMHYHSLNVLPNHELEEYTMKPHALNYKNEAGTGKKQFPFSQMLAFGKKELQYFSEIGRRNDVYLICSARIKATAKARSALIRAQITELNENPEEANYIHFRLHKGLTKTMTLNRVIRLRDVRKARILVNGIASRFIEIEKVEAACISFSDVRAIERKSV